MSTEPWQTLAWCWAASNQSLHGPCPHTAQAQHVLLKIVLKATGIVGSPRPTHLQKKLCQFVQNTQQHLPLDVSETEICIGAY